MIGQLKHEERVLLYNTVYELAPSTALEFGTWQGFGSTFFITYALWENRPKSVARPFLNNSNDWELVTELNTVTGMCKFRKSCDGNKI